MRDALSFFDDNAEGLDNDEHDEDFSFESTNPREDLYDSANQRVSE